jgi:CelD/BcsL family acetyltransferase involved in cellulose biosynthesis
MSSTALFRTDAEIRRQRIERSRPIPVDTSLGAVSLRITGDLQSLEAVWEDLQATTPCTAAQTFDWAQAWVRHVLGPEGREPVIVVGRAADGQVLFLWPFEMAASAGMKVLHWLGQDHANYNMGLFVPEAAANFTASDISALLSEVARATGAAAAILKAQPFSWDGSPNPIAALTHQLTPSSGYAVTLGDFDALYEERSASAPGALLTARRENCAMPGRLPMAGPRRAVSGCRSSMRSLSRGPVNSLPWGLRISSTRMPAPSTARSLCSRAIIQAGSGSAISR